MTQKGGKLTEKKTNRYEILRRDTHPRIWYIWDYVKGGAFCDFFGDVVYYDTYEEAKEELEEMKGGEIMPKMLHNDEVLEKLDWLYRHNKNYTKEQFFIIQELRDEFLDREAIYKKRLKNDKHKRTNQLENKN